jgi:hypothetical protein
MYMLDFKTDEGVNNMPSCPFLFLQIWEKG